MRQKHGLYLRYFLSDDDLQQDNREKSTRIESQRTLLRKFVAAREDLSGEVTEYVDDGYAGTNFDRPAFRKMIDDAKSRKIQTIIVTDFSRFGCDYAGVGDYLEQIFPILGIRFISLNDNYDSRNYQEKAAGLETALGDVVNSFRSRAVSEKLKSAFRMKWQQGKATSGKAPFGYLKNQGEADWRIDPEAGKYVRMIFEKALQGWDTGKIAYYMNEQQIPTPSEYNKMKNLPQNGHNRKVPDSEILWDRGKIRLILSRFEYTGAIVMGKRHNVAVGSKITRKALDRDVVLIRGVNPAIVTEEEYEKARAVIRFMSKSGCRRQKEFLLKGKVRCGTCRLALAYNDSGGDSRGSVYCPHKYVTGKQAKCSSNMYSVSAIEELVRHSVNEIFVILKAIREQGREEAFSEQRKRKQKIKQMDMKLEELRSERIRQYETYTEGVIARDRYVEKKEALTKQIQEIQSVKSALESLSVREEEFENVLNHTISCLEEQMQYKQLTKELLELAVKCVYVYDRDHVEVEFGFEEILLDAIKEYKKSLFAGG